MRDFLRLFLILLLISFFCLILMNQRFMAIYGVVPNFLLIFFLVLIFLEIDYKIIFSLIIANLTLVFFTQSFWIYEYLIILASILPLYLIKPHLTGYKALDFIIALISSKLIFFFISFLIKNSLNSGIWKIFFMELTYDLLLGLGIWFIASINYHAETKS